MCPPDNNNYTDMIRSPEPRLWKRFVLRVVYNRLAAIQEISRLIRIPKVHYRVQNYLLLDHILSQLNPI